MIVDKLQHAGQYAELGERIKKGLEYLKNTDFLNMEPGEYEIDGRNLFAVVQSYNTKPIEEGKLEAHRKYIDIQYLAKGEELIGYAPLNNQEAYDDYNADNDYILYKGENSFVKLSEGMFAIFYPQDLHMPCLRIDEAAPVVKVVLKVLV